MKKIKLQRDFQDCGVTCLSYLIEYYHGYVPLETLREDTHTGIHGTSAYDLVCTLKKYHFDSYGMKVEKNDLKSIKCPFIAHLVLENGLHHFVVVLSFQSKKIVIMDPAKGICKYSYEEFLLWFDGVVIVAFPYQSVPKLKKEAGLLSYYIPILKRNKSFVLMIILCELFFWGVQIGSQFYVKVAMKHSVLNSFWVLTCYFFILICFQCLFSFVKEKLQLVLEKNVELETMYHFLLHILFLPIRKYYSYHQGEILKRVEEVCELKELFSNLCVTFFFEFLFSLVSFGILVFLNFKLALFSFSFLVLCIIIHLILSPFLSRRIREHIENETQFKSDVIEFISCLPSSKHCNSTDYLQNKMGNHLCEVVGKRFWIQNKMLNIEFIKSSFMQILLFFLTGYGLYLVIYKDLSIVDFLTCQNIYVFILKPFQSLGVLLPRLYYFKGIYQKISEYLSIQEEKKEEKTNISFSSIRVSNLSFSYPYQDEVIKSLSFDIKKGEHVFLKGKSGSGKSTLCKILMKEIDGFKGEIIFDSFPIQDINSSLISSNALYLSQNEYLFLGTIKENILFGSSYNHEKFFSVCRICRLDKVVLRKEMRYETTINENSLSGGEKERVLLARALYKDVFIYILDEALASVENSLEIAIINDVKKYLKEKTLLYISHRDLSRYFDKVVEIS